MWGSHFALVGSDGGSPQGRRTQRRVGGFPHRPDGGPDPLSPAFLGQGPQEPRASPASVQGVLPESPPFSQQFSRFSFPRTKSSTL